MVPKAPAAWGRPWTLVLPSERRTLGQDSDSVKVRARGAASPPDGHHLLTGGDPEPLHGDKSRG